MLNPMIMSSLLNNDLPYLRPTILNIAGSSYGQSKSNIAWALHTPLYGTIYRQPEHSFLNLPGGSRWPVEEHRDATRSIASSGLSIHAQNTSQEQLVRMIWGDALDQPEDR